MTTLRRADEEAGAVEGPEAEGPGASAPPSDGRVTSVDALRGLTIFLMIFVNDLGHAAPAWLHHIRPPDGDGMTLADVVFPSFLFIMGVSVPLAIEAATRAGRSRRSQLLHVALRSATLLLMGVVYLNQEEDPSPGAWKWGLLAFLSLIAAWCQVPREPGLKRKILIGLKVAGILGLATALAIFRREPGAVEVPTLGRVEGWAWMRAGWWGILGLIGWAYGTVALITLAVGRRREWLMAALALLMLLHLDSRHGGIFSHLDTKTWLAGARPAVDALARGVSWFERYFVDLGDATGSLAAVAMAGCLLGTVLRRDGDVKSHRDRLAWAGTFAAGLLLAGCLADTFEGVNKIAATPTWCFWSAAFATVLWIGLYLAIDVGGFRSWSIVFRQAGANPLVAYFLHPVVTWLVPLVGLGTILRYTGSQDPRVVVAGSLGMALFVCTAAGILGRLGMRMKV